MSETVEKSEERVGQNWPSGLKEEIRKLVGARGVTEFTIIAVRKELALRARQSSQQPEPRAPGDADPPVDTAPSDVTFDNPITVGGVPAEQRAGGSARQPDRQPDPDASPDVRGEAVTVAPPTMGVSARFSSSSAALEELKAKAAALGVTTASKLPPAPRRDDDPPLAQDVSVVEREEPEPPAPEVELTGQPQQMPGAPAYMQPTRNLDEIEVDF